MKKDQNLPNKNVHSDNSSGKPLPNNSSYSCNNQLIIQTIEDDQKTRDIHKFLTKQI